MILAPLITSAICWFVTTSATVVQGKPSDLHLESEGGRRRRRCILPRLVSPPR